MLVMSSIDAKPPVWLKHYSKVLVACTLFLIFAGGMVTSTGSGLSVPDWPLSYGMVFPPMVGGVFYEHGHRMIATCVGFLTLLLVIFVGLSPVPKAVKKLTLLALLAVIAQGVLGGLTVLFYLPVAISSAHAILGQTFFLLTITIAYRLSDEWYALPRPKTHHPYKAKFMKILCSLIGLLYLQLLVGALMRHTESGLAIYDFPLNAGSLIPTFDQTMLDKINQWRFSNNLVDVQMYQVIVHFMHRVGALVVVTSFISMALWAWKHFKKSPELMKSLYWVMMVLFLQVMLGMITIWSGKMPVPTSFHVAVGALLLGLTTFFTLRVYRSL